MDVFDIPKKVNRHVVKAINCLSEGQCNKRVPAAEIIHQVRYQMRNLVPVRDVERVIQKSLKNLCNFGLLQRCGDSYAFVQNFGPNCPVNVGPRGLVTLNRNNIVDRVVKGKESTCVATRTRTARRHKPKCKPRKVYTRRRRRTCRKLTDNLCASKFTKSTGVRSRLNPNLKRNHVDDESLSGDEFNRARKRLRTNHKRLIPLGRKTKLPNARKHYELNDNKCDEMIMDSEFNCTDKAAVVVPSVNNIAVAGVASELNHTNMNIDNENHTNMNNDNEIVIIANHCGQSVDALDAVDDRVFAKSFAGCQNAALMAPLQAGARNTTTDYEKELVIPTMTNTEIETAAKVETKDETEYQTDYQFEKTPRMIFGAGICIKPVHAARTTDNCSIFDLILPRKVSSTKLQEISPITSSADITSIAMGMKSDIGVRKEIALAISDNESNEASATGIEIQKSFAQTNLTEDAVFAAENSITVIQGAANIAAEYRTPGNGDGDNIAATTTTTTSTTTTSTTTTTTAVAVVDDDDDHDDDSGDDERLKVCNDVKNILDFLGFDNGYDDDDDDYDDDEDDDNINGFFY